jgi:cytochrome P450
LKFILYILNRLRKEIDQILGSRTSINQEDLSEMYYTSAVIKETLRKWSVVVDVNRVAPSNFQINSFEIPEGSWVQV